MAITIDSSNIYVSQNNGYNGRIATVDKYNFLGTLLSSFNINFPTSNGDRTALLATNGQYMFSIQVSGQAGLLKTVIPVLGMAPTIDLVTPITQGLSVAFSIPAGGASIPASSTYLYSLNGGTYVDAISATSPLSITGLTLQPYTVKIKGNGVAGITPVSNTYQAVTPYFIGTAPTNVIISPIANGFRVNLTASTGGNPATPSKYYYALDGSTNYYDASSADTSFDVTRTGLTNKLYTMKVISNSLAGNTVASAASNSVKPYLVGSDPSNVKITPILGGFHFDLSGSVGGNPSPSTYYYSYDSGANYYDASSADASFNVTGLTNQNYTFLVKARNLAGNTAASSVSNQSKPYIKGTDPSNLLVTSITNGLHVDFSGSVGGNPLPSYYYKVDGSGEVLAASSSDTSFNIPNLDTVKVYSIQFYGKSTVGTWQTATLTGSGKPYIKGSVPSNVKITPVLDGFHVDFSGSTGGDPAPSTYYYSLNGGNYIDANTSDPSFSITDLSNQTYTVRVKAISLAGETGVSAASNSAIPLIKGSPPSNVKITPILDGFHVDLSGSTGGNPPLLKYYYSLDSGENYYDASSTDVSFNVKPPGLTNQTYTLILKANNLAGNTVASAASNAVAPYIKGKDPSNLQITRITNGLHVDFLGSVGGNPLPSYYYTVDGGVAVQLPGLYDTSFNIQNLDTVKVYSIQFYGKSTVGTWQTATLTGSGKPYIKGSDPSNVKITPVLDGFHVDFSGSTGGDPAPSTYYYSLNGGNYVNANTSDPSFSITDLSNQTYTLTVKALSSAGETGVSAASNSAIPLIKGSPPSNVLISPIPNGFRVDFSGSTGGNPNPSTYYYSLDSGENYYDASSAVSPFDIIRTDLSNQLYTVMLKAYSSAGYTVASAASNMETPYLKGSDPSNVKITPILGGFHVDLSGSVGGNPYPSTYYYSLDGGVNYINTNSTDPSFNITDLSNQTYTVKVTARNSAGYTAASAASNPAIPYIKGTDPSNLQITRVPNGLRVDFSGSVGGNPLPYYYYTVDSGDAVQLPGLLDTSFSIPNLDIVKFYSIEFYGQPLVGNWTTRRLTGSGKPLIKGSDPSNVVITPVMNGFRVDFSGSVGGDPAPSTYYYSLNSGANYIDSGSAVSPFEVTGLTNQNYTFVVKANSLAGNTAASAASNTAKPNILGTDPSNVLITRIPNGLHLDFSGSVGGNPLPYYYYTVDGSGEVLAAGPSDTSLNISDLFTVKFYNIEFYAKPQNGAWQTTIFRGSGKPYIKGTDPSNVLITPILDGFRVDFSGSIGGDPAPPTYYYSLDGGANYINSGSTVSPFEVTGLINQNYTFVLKAYNSAGYTGASATSNTAKPLIKGSAPSNVHITPITNGFRIDFSGSVGGNPDPPTYYYSLDGGANYIDSGATVSPFEVTGLINQNYTFVLKAYNSAGYTGVSAASNTAKPLIIGSDPSNVVITPIVDGFRVDFSGSIGGNPAPPTYYYSLDGGANYIDSGSSVSPFNVTGLTNQDYTFVLKAYNSAGYTGVSAASNTAKPLIKGSEPSNVVITPIVDGFRVDFSGSIGGYPPPSTYYYSLDSGANYIDSGSAVSPFEVTGLINQNYTFVLKAYNSAGYTGVSTASNTAKPLIKGSDPSNVYITPILGGFRVDFSGSIGGNPPPSTYYYSLDGGSSYIDSSSAVSPFNVTGLTNQDYTFLVKAYNSAGYTGVSAASNTAKPNIRGSDPSNVLITAITNGLHIDFSGSVGGNPLPYYYYTVDGSGEVLAAGPSDTSFNIPGVADAKNYNIEFYAKPQNGAWQTTIFRGSGKPYIKGSDPSNVIITPILDGFRVDFSGSVGGDPAPSTYYYSLDSGANYIDSGSAVSPFEVTGLTNQYYTFVVKANSLAGNTAASAASNTAKPLIKGSDPSNVYITPILDGFRVDFSGSVGGNPDPPTYFYSLDGGANYIDSGSTVSPFEVTGLKNQDYTFLVKAYNSAGYTGVSAASNTTKPLIKGSDPSNVLITPILDGFRVDFSISVGGNPSPPTYYYSLDGGVNYIDSGSTVSPFNVTGLTNQDYTFLLKAYNAAGYTGVSAASNTAKPNIRGTDPSNVLITRIPNGLHLDFSGSVGGNPLPYYYYTVDGSGEVLAAGPSDTSFNIPSLDTAKFYNIEFYAKPQNGAWQTTIFRGSGKPYIKGSDPSNVLITPILDGFRVDFSESVGGDPAPPTYYYSLDSGANYIDSGSTSSPFNVTGLTNQDYTFLLKAYSLAGYTGVSAASNTAKPNIRGTDPSNVQITPIFNGLRIDFSGSVGGNPPLNYYYKVDGGSAVLGAGPSDTTFDIPSLFTAKSYSIEFYGENAAGKTVVYTGSGEPFIRGSDPSNLLVTSVRNGLRVDFSGSVGGNPLPTYYYKLDGSGEVLAAGSSETFFTIPGLFTAKRYSIEFYGKSPAGPGYWYTTTLTSSGDPYIVGSDPSNLQITSRFNELLVNFSGSVGGYPLPDYYYKVDGGTAVKLTGLIDTSFAIPNLDTAKDYSVEFYGKTVDWQTSSITSSGKPFIRGSDPSNIRVSSIPNGLHVDFTGSVGGNPLPTYYYKVDGSGAVLAASTYDTSFDILNLDVARSYSVEFYAESSAGPGYWKSNVYTSSGDPYIIGNGPSNLKLSSIMNGLHVDFSGSTGVNPLPDYYYTVDGGPEVLGAGPLDSSFDILGLDTAKYYSIQLYGKSAAGQTNSITRSGIPNIKGTPPSNLFITSIPNGLHVDFSGSTGGNPLPNYYYKVDGGQEVLGAGPSDTSFNIRNLDTAKYYSVEFYGKPPGGEWQTDSVTSSGEPYIVGSDPSNVRITSIFNGLRVDFSGSVGSYPPQDYYYKVDGSGEVLAAGPLDASFEIPHLDIARRYSVEFYGKNAAGKTSIYTSSGEPYIVGSDPSNIRVSSIRNGLHVDFSGSVGGNPRPTYYYKVDGSGAVLAAGPFDTSFDIPRLDIAKRYSVEFYGESSAGPGYWKTNVYTSSGEPYIVGSDPTNLRVTSTMNGLRIDFSGSVGGYPLPDYYYKLDGGPEVKSAGPYATSFTIAGLNTIRTYNIEFYGKSETGHWQTGSLLSSGVPFIKGTNPSNFRITSIPNGLRVDFSGSVGGNPLPDYYYTVDGGSAVKLVGLADTSFNIPNLFTAKTYNIEFYGKPPGGDWQTDSVTGSGVPYIVGSDPSNIRISSVRTGLRVDFSGSVGGYPQPDYYYKVDSGSAVKLVGLTDASFTIPNLNLAKVYSVEFYGENAAGKTRVFVGSGEPYIVGSDPSNLQITSRFNELRVDFSGSVGGHPLPDYYYKVDGGAEVKLTGLTDSSFTIPNLNTAQDYSVEFYGKTVDWQTSSITRSGKPFIRGSDPTNFNVIPIPNGLHVDFAGSVGGNPLPTYYYKLNGGAEVSAAGPYDTSFNILNLGGATKYSLEFYGRAANWNTNSVTISGDAYTYAVGSDPSNIQISSRLNSLHVDFSGSVGGNPLPSYYYTLDGGAPVKLPGLFDTSFDIPNLNFAKQYLIQFYGDSGVWQTNVFTGTGKPFVKGSDPSILNIASIPNGLHIDFSGSVGGYPMPSYYYQLDGSGEVLAAGPNETSFNITNLYTAKFYGVEFYAYTPEWGKTRVSTSFGKPYVLGIPPFITNVQPGINKLTVSFNPSTGGHLPPSSYSYSLDFGFYQVITNLSGNTFEIRGLSSGSHNVSMIANNSAGSTAASNMVTADSYEIGSRPAITDMTSISNGFVVKFDNSTGGYPAVETYYYSLDGINYLDALTSDASFTVTGLTLPASYNVTIYAKSRLNAWTSPISNITVGTPFVVGNAPEITYAVANYNSIEVQFKNNGAYPEPTQYYYSIDGVNYVLVDTVGYSFTISNLESGIRCILTMTSKNSVGYSPPSEARIINTLSTVTLFATTMNALYARRRPIFIGAQPFDKSLTSTSTNTIFKKTSVDRRIGIRVSKYGK